MKRTLLTLSVFAVCYCSYGQNSRPKTLIGNDPEEISGFGAVLFSFTPVDGELSTLTGGGGAVLFDNSFFIGGYGLSLTGNKETELAEDTYSSSYGHGGIWLGYNIKPENLVHFGVDTKLGWGQIKTRSSALTDGSDKDPVFVFSPQVFAEANIAYWFKVNAGAGFQKTVGVDNDYFQPSDFDGPTFNISLLFGWFN